MDWVTILPTHYDQYIGETKRMLKLRLAVRNSNTATATGFHVHSPGHSLSEMEIMGI